MNKEIKNHPELNFLARTGVPTTASSNTGRPDCSPVPPVVLKQTPDERFRVWVHSALGREIANQFIRASCGLKSAGWKQYGAKRIIEGIRWNVHLQNGPKTDDEFKVNNNMVSRLARFAESKCPELSGFFEKRMLHT